MSVRKSSQAQTLEDAYNNFYFMEPLAFSGVPTPGRNKEYFVDRPLNPYEKLKRSLLLGSNPEKFLFAGHRGAGKSTELARLIEDAEIKVRFLVVNYSILDVLDLNDIEYPEFLVALGAQIFLEMEKNNVPLEKETLKRIEDWGTAIEEKLKESSEKASAAGGVNLKALFLDWRGRIQKEASTRRIVREVIEPRLRDLMDSIQKLIMDGSANLGDRQLLVIVQDLDRLTDDKAEKLFHNAGPYLAEPRCKAIYTLPISFHFDARFTSVITTIGKSVTLPNVKLWGRDDPERRLIEPGAATMKGFIENRMNLDLIEPDALQAAVWSGGGRMRELARLMQGACIAAITKKRPKIDRPVVDEAVGELRHDYVGLFAWDENCKTLDETDRTKRLAEGEAGLRLLNSGHILMYENGENDVWYDVNPITLPLLERWRKFYRP